MLKSHFSTRLAQLALGICLSVLGFTAQSGEVKRMYPELPAPPGMTLVYESHFNQVDIITNTPMNFYLEVFMGKPYWIDPAKKVGATVNVKGRSNYGDRIEEFEERHTIIDSNCDEVKGQIQKTYLKNGKSRAPRDWEYVKANPQNVKMFSKTTSPEDVIATRMCQALNPYFDGTYMDSVNKQIMESYRKENPHFGEKKGTEDED